MFDFWDTHERATPELKIKIERSVHEIMRLLLETKGLNPSIPWPDEIEGGVNFPAVWHDPIEKRILWWYGLVVTSPSRVVDELGSTNVFIQAWGFSFIHRISTMLKLQKWNRLGRPLPWLNKDEDKKENSEDGIDWVSFYFKCLIGLSLFFLIASLFVLAASGFGICIPWFLPACLGDY